MSAGLHEPLQLPRCLLRHPVVVQESWVLPVVVVSNVQHDHIRRSHPMIPGRLDAAELLNERAVANDLHQRPSALQPCDADRATLATHCALAPVEARFWRLARARRPVSRRLLQIHVLGNRVAKKPNEREVALGSQRIAQEEDAPRAEPAVENISSHGGECACERSPAPAQRLCGTQSFTCRLPIADTKVGAASDRRECPPISKVVWPCDQLWIARLHPAPMQVVTVQHSAERACRVVRRELRGHVLAKVAICSMRPRHARGATWAAANPLGTDRASWPVMPERWHELAHLRLVLRL
mmetsp:Transcript_62252/g.185244  ORF Transcript_62252/g.185244 Transcript_62252/m.185244 type:complete len:297 (-) Transcript_62252:707-1597(-)